LDIEEGDKKPTHGFSIKKRRKTGFQKFSKGKRGVEWK